LRERGAAIADLVVLIVDINEGFNPQTKEAVEILRTFKVPFIVAANKVDKIEGWKKTFNFQISESLAIQRADVLEKLDKKIYDIVAALGEFGFSSDRFDRISDPTREIMIVPVSAKTGEGIAEILLFLSALSQKYLEKKLRLHVSGKAKATILELKEEKGIKYADIILYDGILEKNDPLLFLSLDGIKKTKVRGIFIPQALSDIRHESAFKEVERVVASAGVRVYLSESSGIIAGSPLLYDQPENYEELSKLEKELSFTYDNEGIILKVDTIGSLEALVKVLKRKGIKIFRAGLGDVTKKDINEAKIMKEKNEEYGFVLGFNVRGAEDKDIKIIVSNVIYDLEEKYDKEIEKMRKEKLEEELKKVGYPVKLEVLDGFIFRKSKPAIFGVKVLSGELHIGTMLKNRGKVIGSVKSIQSNKESLQILEEGKEAAISIDSAKYPDDFKEGDILYVAASKRDYANFDKLPKKWQKLIEEAERSD